MGVNYANKQFTVKNSLSRNNKNMCCHDGNAVLLKLANTKVVHMISYVRKMTVIIYYNNLQFKITDVSLKETISSSESVPASTVSPLGNFLLSITNLPQAELLLCLTQLPQAIILLCLLSLPQVDLLSRPVHRLLAKIFRLLFLPSLTILLYSLLLVPVVVNFKYPSHPRAPFHLMILPDISIINQNS